VRRANFFRYFPGTWVTVYTEHIGNTFEPKGSAIGSPGFVVKVAQIVVHERDEPQAIADLGDAHVLSGQRMTQIDLAAMEADPPTVRLGSVGKFNIINAYGVSGRHRLGDPLTAGYFTNW